jgi:hypothetical protein
MRMFRHFPKARDIPAILITFVVVAVFLYVRLKYPDRQPASGFGPEWQCSGVGRGRAAFCIRKPATDSANRTTTPD